MGKSDLERATDLAKHWDSKLGKEGTSVFWQAVERAKRYVPLHQQTPKNMSKYKDEISDIAVRIMRGEPLTFREFHLAVAEYMLLTEVTYEDFFMNHWGETHHHHGIGVGQ